MIAVADELAPAVGVAREFGARVITASSSENAGSATAAYAARAGLECVLFTVQRFPTAMKVNMAVYGTRLIACPTLVDRWRMVEKCVDTFDWFPTAGFMFPLIGSNPSGIDGYKTIAYEPGSGAIQCNPMRLAVGKSANDAP